MSVSAASAFKPPPVVECLSREHCLGFGQKVYVANRICNACLRRHDPQQLREWANGNRDAISILDEEYARKQNAKRNLEARGRFFCAFEDPDYMHCRWRRSDLNLRGTRINCSMVRRKGMACGKCWKRHLQKFGIVQHFTPLGLCHEEADKATESLSAAHSIVADEESFNEDDDDDDDDDVEGYNTLL